MHTATLSEKFQICIPKEVREKMHLKVGQKFIFIPKGNSLYLVPALNVKQARGMIAGADPNYERDHRDRV